MSNVSRETPRPPDDALVASVFGDARPAVERYVGWLAGAGVERGLLGPREVPRLWERHVLNCAVVAPLLADGAALGDVGSGAGLPGLVVALRRPDVRVTLIEPLLRRTTFLEEVVADLGLDNVEVMRDRAEGAAHAGRVFDAVTARAVAPLAKLARWCLPLCRPGGELLALKGRTAAEELEASAGALAKLGGRRARVEELRVGEGGEPTYVVRIESTRPQR